MNWLIRLGRWWEERRVIRASEFENCLASLHNRCDGIESSRRIPTQIEKDMAILRAQVDQLQLFVGLKRSEPIATHVQGAPKIG